MRRQFLWFSVIVILWTVVVPLSDLDSAQIDDRSVPTDGSTGRCLLLKNGRVLKGEIFPSASGYLVRTRSGEVSIPSDSVQFEATSVADVYGKLRDSIPKPTATQHVDLAKWCLLNQLFEEARQELRHALLLEPQFETARTMLSRLDDVTGNETVLPEPEPLHSEMAAPDPDEVLQARSLASLPRELSRDYVCTIQPLFMNKCASASCHGPEAPSEFRMTRIRPGRASHRVFVERNLASILKYVDSEKPDDSPLLIRMSDGHGERGRSLFYGLHGSRQIEQLRTWVRAVSETDRDSSQIAEDAFTPDAFNTHVSSVKKEFRASCDTW